MCTKWHLPRGLAPLLCPLAPAGVVLVLTTSCATPGLHEVPAEEPPPGPSEPAEILASLEPEVPVAGEPGWTLAERMEHYDVPAVSLAVWDDYEIVWTAAFGMADVEERIPATARTLFQAGSISKPVAAAAVLAAAERGELDLDAPINSLLESWKLPENELTAEAPVTLRRLLSHTAGTTVHGFPGYSVDQEIPTIQQVLDGLPPANTAPVRVDLAPGTEFRYSGGGSTVMQLVMSERFDLPYPELMRRRVLAPLGMTDSTYEQPLPPDRLDSAAAGYERDGDPVWGKHHLYPEMAAAGLWTTPTDLARFALDLQRASRGDADTLLRGETVEEMVTPVLGESGLGLFQIESNGALYFGHNGADEGFQAMLVASRNGGHGAAVMANSDHGIALAREILPAIARAFGWPGLAPEPLVPADVDPEDLEVLTGLYRVRDHRVLEVTRRGDRLMSRYLLDDRPTRLIPKEDGSFVAQTSGEILRFEPGADGRAAGYRNTLDETGDLRPRLDDDAEPYVVLFDSGRPDEALDRLATDEVEESYLNSLGYTLLRFGHPDEALAVFLLMVERHPRSANAWDSLADGYETLDDLEGAAEASRKVLEVLPEDEEISPERKPSYEARARERLRRLADRSIE